MTGRAHHHALRIYYGDTDAGGVVYHANYLEYFERARWEMLASCGIDLRAASEAGVGSYVVTDAHLQYRRPARLGDMVTIVSSLAEVRAATCVVQQQVRRDGLLLVEGRIGLAFVGPNGKPRRQPPAWIAAFGRIMGATRGA